MPRRSCAPRDGLAGFANPGHHDGTRPVPPTLPPPFEPLLDSQPLVRVDTSDTLDEVELVQRVRATTDASLTSPRI